MTTIHLHSSLQRFADNFESIEIPGNCTLIELLNRLVEEYPRLKSIIFSSDHQISSYLVIFINGEDSRYLPLDYKLMGNTNVEIITSLVGG